MPETVLCSAFLDKSQEPEAADLSSTLGRSWPLWEELKFRISVAFDPVAEEWTYAGKNYGWSLRLKQKKRAILYMTPCEGYFRAAFAFGEKAVAAAESAGLPEAVMEIIKTATRYPEGRAVRLQVRTRKDVGVVEKLAVVKMAN